MHTQQTALKYTYYAVDVTLECQTVVLRTDDLHLGLDDTRQTKPRAERHHRQLRRPLGAIPAATGISVSRSVRSTAKRRAATSWSATSRVRASDRCSSETRLPQPRRAPNATDAHQGRLRGPSRRLSTSPARGASVAPRSAELRPPGPPPAASARSPAAAPAALAAEAPEAALRLPLLPTTAASRGDPRL